MTDKLKTDSIDFIATKQDFIELMDENVRLQKELMEVRQATIDEAVKAVSERSSALNEKLKDVIRLAVLVCEYRTGDIDTEDGSFAATDIDTMIRLEEALCDALDAPSDNIRMLDVRQNIEAL